MIKACLRDVAVERLDPKDVFLDPPSNMLKRCRFLESSFHGG